LSLSPHPPRASVAALPTTPDRRRGEDRRRTHRERRQLLLKQSPDDERRRASYERRSGLDRRVARLHSPRPAAALPVSTRPLGLLIDLYA
jgi:hypothetical protein